jgi:ABC-type transport system involved in multi-copper enzyme maturation permease subunit
MPIAELGYRHWTGKRTGLWGRCLAIARSEALIAYESSRLLRRFIVFAWLPILYFCPIFLAFGVVADPSGTLEPDSLLAGLARNFLSAEAIERLRANPDVNLPAIWSLAFFFFFAYTQSLFSMIVVAIVAPPLISKDLRSRAFLVYLSKPIQPWQYLLGKLSTVVFFVFAMTLFPACFLYLVGVALSPDASTLLATLPILAHILLCSLVIALPVALVVLLLSSLTKDRKVATFLWVALWVFGEFAFRVISGVSNFDDTPGGSPWAGLLSLRELTTRASSGIFAVRDNMLHLITQVAGEEDRSRGILRELSQTLGSLTPTVDASSGEVISTAYPPLVSMLVLGLISLVCTLVLLQRIRRQVTI